MLKNSRAGRNFFSYYGIKLRKIDFFFRKLIDLHPATDIVADKGRVYKVIISKRGADGTPCRSVRVRHHSYPAALQLFRIAHTQNLRI